MPNIPEYIGVYVYSGSFVDNSNSNKFTEFFSIQMCHTKLAFEGKTTTYRYREFKREGYIPPPLNGLLPQSEARTEAECADLAL